MTASFQAQHIIPGDIIRIDGQSAQITSVSPAISPSHAGYILVNTTVGARLYPKGRLVTVTEAAQRPRRA